MYIMYILYCIVNTKYDNCINYSLYYNNQKIMIIESARSFNKLIHFRFYSSNKNIL